MDTPPVLTNYKHHRFPVKIISHAVWLYFRCCLSFREVEELLGERGIKATSGAIRKWCRKCGQPYANQLRRRPRPGDKCTSTRWYSPSKVNVTICGGRWTRKKNVLDILMQRRCNKRAAKKFFYKLLKGSMYGPRRDRYR
jgi:putative transposase